MAKIKVNCNKASYFPTEQELANQIAANYSCVGEGCINPYSTVNFTGGKIANLGLINADPIMRAAAVRRAANPLGYESCLLSGFLNSDIKTRSEVTAFVNKYLVSSSGASLYSYLGSVAIVVMFMRNEGALILSRVASKNYPGNRWLFLDIHKFSKSHAWSEGWIPVLNSIAANDELPIDERIEAASYAEATIKSIQDSAKDFDNALKLATIAFGGFAGLGFVTSAALKVQKIEQIKEAKELKAAATSVAPIPEETITPDVVVEPIIELPKSVVTQKVQKKENEQELGLAAVAGIASWLLVRS